MAEFGRGVEALKTQLGRNLPEGITAEVEVYFQVKNSDFGEWHCKIPKDAIAVKAKCDEGSAIMSMLPRAIDEDCRFANGGGYVQHPEKAVEVFINAVRGFIEKHYTPEEHDLAKDKVLAEFDKNPRLPGFLKLFADNDSVVGTVYERLCCIDEAGREWGQCGYALKSYPDWDLRTEREWKKVA